MDKIIKMKPLKKMEEIFIIRSCLRDGLTQKQAKKYVNSLGEVVRANHKANIKKMKKEKKKKLFKEEFKKLKKK